MSHRAFTGRVTKTTLAVAMAATVIFSGSVSVSGSSPLAFDPPTDIPIGGGYPWHVAAVDVNHDGHVDLLSTSLQDGILVVSLGNGDGTFAGPAGYASSLCPRSLVTGDFNEDGRLDVAIANNCGDAVSVLLGDGTGGFGAPIVTSPGLGGTYSNSLAVGDFNEDGHLDLVVGYESLAPAVVMLVGAGDGTFTASALTTASLSVTGLASGDFNGDGHLDVAATFRYVSGLVVFLGAGNGAFTASTLGGGGWAVTSGDLNEDGIADFATIIGDGAQWWLGRAAGPPVLAGYAPFAGIGQTAGNPAYLAIGDVDGDGHLDIVGTDPYTRTVGILPGRGDGTFESVQSFPGGWPGPVGVVLADFNEDGRTDIVAWTGGTGTRYVELLLASPSQQAQVITFDPLPARTFGDPPGTLSATASSGLPVTFTATGPCSASESTLDLLGAGTCSVTASQAGDANWAPASDVTQSFTVAKATLTVTADDKTKVLGAPNPPLTATISGYQNGETLATSGVTGSPSLATTATTSSAVGTYPIVAAIGDLSATNYSFVFVNGSLRVQYQSGGTCQGDAGHAILQPINADGTSVFKFGSTVPAKFRVCDANGASVGTPGVVSSFRLVRMVTGTAVSSVDEAVISTTPDTDFRWSSTDQQWIFNMATKSMSPTTTYYYRITLDDGTYIDFYFGLR